MMLPVQYWSDFSKACDQCVAKGKETKGRRVGEEKGMKGRKREERRKRRKYGWFYVNSTQAGII